jgi:hypothetical protein
MSCQKEKMAMFRDIYDPSTTNRERWADHIDRLIANQSQSKPWRPRPYRPLYAPAVVRACVPALSMIRETLSDEHATVTPTMLRQLHTFLCDGVDSPLLGNDPLTAKMAANEVAVSFQLAAPAREPQRTLATKTR